MPRIEREIEYEGKLKKLYNIRLYTKRDIAIRDKLKSISNEFGIPLESLLLDHLEKGLNLAPNFSLNKKGLIGGFDNFFKKCEKKVSSLEKLLEMEIYKKRKSLRDFIYNKFPNEDQRKIFCLRVIKTQISAEIKLFSILFSLNNPLNSYFIDYYSYFSNSNKIQMTEDFKNSLYNEITTEILNEWFNELKTKGIIKDFEDLQKAKINYVSLEKYIFNLYKDTKMLSSMKDREERLKNIEQYRNEKKKKNRTWADFLKGVFKEIAKFYFGSEDKKVLDKIGLKPYIIFEKKILDKKGYFDYLMKPYELRKAFVNAIDNKYVFYGYLNWIRTQFSFSQPFVGELHKFEMLKEFLDQIITLLDKDLYDREEILNLQMYLERIKIGHFNDWNVDSLNKINSLINSVKENYSIILKKIEKSKIQKSI